MYMVQAPASAIPRRKNTFPVYYTAVLTYTVCSSWDNPPEIYMYPYKAKFGVWGPDSQRLHLLISAGRDIHHKCKRLYIKINYMYIYI